MLTVHERLSLVAAQSPDAVAVSAGGRTLSYAKLHSLSNQLAAGLVSGGVAVGLPVAVYANRTPETIVSQLAVLKAGGYYVPISPNDPPARRRAALAALEIRHAVGDPQFISHASADGLTWLSPLDAASAFRVSVSADAPAYAMFTSGSTGRPKAVLVPHRGIVRLVVDSNYVRFDSADSVLQIAPFTFDGSTFEVWGALLNGSRLVLAPDGDLTLREIADVVEEEQITVALFTSGLFAAIVDAYPETVARVPQLLAGGDIVSARHVRALFDLPGARTIINAYGPTEATTIACAYPMRQAGDVEDPIPIGMPISGTDLAIIDSSGDPVEDGVVGELVISGDGVALGYVGEPRLTDERFPCLASLDGRRVYRTGDLARRRSDGMIEFLGRDDDQLKVRGFRIELGEIEAALSSIGAIRASAVAAHKDESGATIVAFVVPAGESLVDDMRNELAAILPRHMIPEIVLLDVLPLTANGKVDRRALVDEWLGRRAVRAAGLFQSETEQTVAQLWSEVLGVDPETADDDFFYLGGDSLLAMRMIDETERRFAVSLSLRDVFTHSQLRSLAAHIDSHVVHDSSTQ